LETIVVFVVMVPSVLENSESILALSPAYAGNTWVHFGLGVFAEVFGFWFVGLWLFLEFLIMQCSKAKKYKTPILVLWIIAILSGALIHVLQIF